ncbi:MAG: Zn-ribbon domain-containing OB-fold protein [Promethearchaeota archaeon]
MTLNLDEIGDIYVTKGMVRAEFNFWVGIPMDKFYDGLENKKFVGNKCPKCGKVFCPPRKICGDCFAECKEFVDLPETGILKNYTVTNWKIQERKGRKVKKDMIIGLVQVDGADSSMLIPIVNTTPDEVKEGMKVKVVWAKRIKGHPNDIAGFEPA